MMDYLWWVPLTAVCCYIGSWLSVMANKEPNSIWFWLMFLPIGMWPFISRISKNLIFDALLYDSLVVLFYFGGFYLLGATHDFKMINYVGAALVIGGLILLKIQ